MGLADAIIVGSGLAGLTVALTILDQGGSVVILEKEAKLGGNSIKASSGINQIAATTTDNDDCDTTTTTTAAAKIDDSIELFTADTTISAGATPNAALIETLVTHSHAAVEWLKERIQADLSERSQLGGHSAARTHRPAGKLPVGAEIMSKLQKAVQAHCPDDDDDARVQILTQARVTEILTNSAGRVCGVSYTTTNDGETQSVQAPHVVLATGGFASDRSSTGSLLQKYRPELVQFATTGGPFSTGDGIVLAQQAGLQALTVDMDKVQVHPTGWVDPKDPGASSKFLAAEVMRGVGGILINQQGQRFCNELGRRDYVTDKILSLHADYAKTHEWQASYEIPQIHLLLSQGAAKGIDTHVGFYIWKGLMAKVEGGVEALAQHLGVEVNVLRATLQDYQQAAASQEDKFGKKNFANVPQEDDDVFYTGLVTPVLHYCMGGLAIDTQGQVLDQKQRPIDGLFACGEVAGGVHGANRLAGNSLLECVVYGRIVGNKIVAQKEKISTRSLIE